ncbi:MerR family transcriptional regulator [Pseudobowmanella zhangzhouensis]|uniref:MerR family transcriptional regulator n=1 Tax=Pseudobowmanella zhangzhouensis TaxID=1537679 RepID=UPI00360A6AF1
MADYSLSELETLTGLAARTIRFYIQKGLVQAPFGARKTPVTPKNMLSNCCWLSSTRMRA